MRNACLVKRIALVPARNRGTYRPTSAVDRVGQCGIIRIGRFINLTESNTPQLAAGLVPDQIDAVVRTGGSSNIPAFLDMLGDLFSHDRLLTEDLFTMVTADLGICAWERDT
jgi:hypothetical protein